MDHRSAREAIVDGQTDDTAVQEHLATCAACSRFHEALLVVDRLAPTIVETATPPVDLVARTLKYVSRHFAAAGSRVGIVGGSRHLLPDAARTDDGFQTLLRRFRGRAGMTQQELAERSGLSNQAISALERGHRRSPRPSTVRFLASALQLSDEERAFFLSAAKPSADALRAIGRALSDQRHGAVLTARELEVARFIAQRLSNKEIAVRLGVSEHAAAEHLVQICIKLGLNSRAQIIAWVARNDADA